MRYITYCFIILFINAHAISGDTSRVKKEWANIGFGSSKHNSSYSANAFNFGFNYQRAIKKIFFQAGFNGNILSNSSAVNAFNLSLGYARTGKSFLIGGSTGPAVMWGNIRRGNFEFESEPRVFSTMGLTSAIQFIYKPAKDIGIGAELFSNLNRVQSNYGWRIALSISCGF